MLDSDLLFDILLAMAFLYYGYKYRYLTPDWESMRGVVTKHTKMNRENWKIGHAFAGTLCFCYSGAFFVTLALKYFVIGYENSRVLYAQIAAAFLMILSVPFATEAWTKKHGSEKNEYKRERTKGLRDAIREAAGDQPPKKGKKSRK